MMRTTAADGAKKERATAKAKVPQINSPGTISHRRRVPWAEGFDTKRSEDSREINRGVCSRRGLIGRGSPLQPVQKPTRIITTTQTEGNAPGKREHKDKPHKEDLNQLFRNPKLI